MSGSNGKREEVPDPEVVPTAERRRFSAEEKLVQNQAGSHPSCP